MMDCLNPDYLHLSAEFRSTNRSGATLVQQILPAAHPCAPPLAIQAAYHRDPPLAIEQSNTKLPPIELSSDIDFFVDLSSVASSNVSTATMDPVVELKACLKSMALHG